MSSIALHQNCHLNSRSYLPTFNPNSHWLTTSVLSQKRLPTPTSTGLKEHLQGHHQSCQFTSTAGEMLPETWHYRFPIQRIGSISLPSSHHLKGSLWSYQNEMAQTAAKWLEQALLGLHTLACPKQCLFAPSPVCCCSITDAELLSSHKAQGDHHLSST